MYLDIAAYLKINVRPKHTKQSRAEGVPMIPRFGNINIFFPFVTHPLLVSVDDVELRLLPTFAGILQEKIRSTKSVSGFFDTLIGCLDFGI